MRTRWTLTAAAVVLLVAAVVTYVAMQPAPADPRVRQIAVNTQGDRAAAALADGRVFTWPLAGSAAPDSKLVAATGLNDIEFSPDGRWLGVAGGNIALTTWDRKTVPEYLRGDGENYGTVRFDAAGRRVASISGKSQVLILDIAGKEIVTACCSSIYGDIRWLPGDTRIASAGHWPAVWDAASGKLIARLTREREFMTFGPIVVLSARNEILMGSQDGGIRAWSLNDYKLAASSPRTSDWVETMALRPGTDWIAYAQRAKNVRWWNRATNERREWPQ
ncbi:MAG: hypothetical protein ABI972_25015, partial [Acidobacteriota bacterium]